MPRVSILIVTYNNASQIQRCLNAVAAQDFSDFDVVVIDNASTDGTPDRITLPDSRFSLVRNADNTGFAAANNQAAAATHSEFIATLNPDAYPARDWLRCLIDAADAHPAAAFGSTQISDADPARYDGLGDTFWIGGLYWRGGYGHRVRRESPPGLSEVFAACAAAALYRRADFEALGGFDEGFFCYGEDVDLSFRLQMAGRPVLQVGAALVRHEGYASSARHSDFAAFHGSRNRVWVWLKNMPAVLMIPLLPLFILTQAAMALRDLAMLRPAALRGLIAAIVGLGPVWRQRRTVQEQRQASIRDLLRVMAVSPHRLLTRDALTRPVGQSES